MMLHSRSRSELEPVSMGLLGEISARLLGRLLLDILVSRLIHRAALDLSLLDIQALELDPGD